MHHFAKLETILRTNATTEQRIAKARRIAVVGGTRATWFERTADRHFHLDPESVRGGGQPPIEPLEAILDMERDGTLVIINDLMAREITATLRKAGFGTVMDLTHLDWRGARLLDRDFMAENMESIRRVFDLLADEVSKNVYLSLLLFRLLHDPTLLRFSDYAQYFHPRLPFAPGEVVIDGGAFVGDSATDFLRATGGDATVYSFEPEWENYHRLAEMVRVNKLQDRVLPLPHGLWKENGTLNFSAASQSSRITDEGGTSISVVQLDSLCSRAGIAPTAIKLDVEGAEIETLDGARRTIDSARPKLLVSLYHRADHLWDIPLLLAERGDYTFFVGHHPPELTIYETVLYALPA